MRSNRKVEEESGDSKPWLASFADLMSVLFTFFVLLFGMSTIEEQQFIQVLQSFGNPVINITQPNTGDGFEAYVSPGIGFLDPFSISPYEGRYEDPPADGGDVSEYMQALILEFETNFLQTSNPFTHAGFSTADERDGTGQTAAIAGQAGEQGQEDLIDGPIITVLNSGEILITFPDMLFPSGSSALVPASIEALNALGSIFDDFPMFELMITGHTDNIPINTPVFPDNWMLSNARAHSVAMFFINNHGIPPYRIEIRGRGEYDPIATNETPEGRAQNRRVEILVTEVNN
ncbi:MAG: flagellar motor protein MotB [Defluviitaleaceae bacterium]|nr:flagellar motor protein MotB [Defluviitaleaceae bacterium]